MQIDSNVKVHKTTLAQTVKKSWKLERRFKMLPVQFNPAPTRTISSSVCSGLNHFSKLSSFKGLPTTDIIHKFFTELYTKPSKCANIYIKFIWKDTY